MTPPFDLKAINRIKGFLDEAEGAALYRIAAEAVRVGPCLEIGSYCGKSTVWIGAACKENGGILFSVDHHAGSEEQQPGEEYFDPELFDGRFFRVDTFAVFRKTIEDAGLAGTVVPVVCHSEVAARAWATGLGLVFVDGGHALETVRTDYLAWSPHVLPGGYLLFHDIFKHPDEGGQAPFLIYQEALSSGLFEEMDMVRTLGVLRRR